jgi:pentatricopeptide repeat protein
MRLYEQSLKTVEQLGDVRAVAVTQHSMADVLVKRGRIDEAMRLYEQSLKTIEQLGDVRSVAVTKANMAQVLFAQRKHADAVNHIWASYLSLTRLGLPDAKAAAQILAGFRSALGSQAFDQVWRQAVADPMPDWLSQAPVESPGQGSGNGLTAEQRRVIVANTIAVMTAAADRHQEWWQAISGARAQAAQMRAAPDESYLQAILALLERRQPELPADHLYGQDWRAILDGIAHGGPLEGNAPGEAPGADVDATMQAIQEFVNTDDWDAARRVVDAQQAVLLSPQAEAIFEQNIAQARAGGDARWADTLATHLGLLRDCQSLGIPAAFEKITQPQVLPFDAALIAQTVAALRGGPRDRQEHARRVSAALAQAGDEDLQAFLGAIQTALFGGDVQEVGQPLRGVYAQAWQAIVVGVKGDQALEVIAANTLAVLGPAADRRGEWRDNLVDLRNQAVAAGDRGFAGLLEAATGLLDAGGNPAGLGAGLAGVYADAWRAIVDGLAAGQGR